MGQPLKPEERCQMQLLIGERGWHAYRPCKNKAVVGRDKYQYCKIHDPEYVNAKREKRHAQWEAEYPGMRAPFHREAVLGRIFEGISTEDIEANAEAIKRLIKIT